VLFKGRLLTCPEVVGFRMTRNLEAPLGALGSAGLFQRYFKLIFGIYLNNKPAMLTQVKNYFTNPFIHSSGESYQAECLQLFCRGLSLGSAKQTLQVIVLEERACGT